VPAKPVASRPIGSPPARGAAARPKPLPAPPGQADTTSAPATEGTEPAPAESATAEPESAAPEAPVIEEPPPANAASRRSGGPEYELQAISKQNGQPVAMLNDRLVHEGDTFDNVKVVRIGTDEVEIEVSGHRRIVKF
jgi:hypothetical protein